MVSGGVDSTVCAALLHKALNKEQVIPVHINNGFMRKGETPFVEESLAQLGIKLRIINASHTFMQGTTSVPLDIVPPSNVNSKGIAGLGGSPRTRLTKMLCATTNPEEKRKIIGDVFVRVANDAMTEMGLKPEEVFLGQGTLRPDLIESASSLASGKADAIKTHHNDSELVRALRSQGRVVEPLKDFHKDEVRQLGCDLGLPAPLVQRHPFPGPGLAIRILCADEPFMDKDFSETQVIIVTIIHFDWQDRNFLRFLGNFVAGMGNHSIFVKFYSRLVHFKLFLIYFWHLKIVCETIKKFLAKPPKRKRKKHLDLAAED